MAYQFECPREGCAFELRCNVDEEATRLARAHARVAHRGRFAPADLKRWVEPV